MQHCNLKGVDLLFNITLLTQKWTLLLHSSFWNMFETYNLWSCPKIYELFSWCNGQDVPLLNPKRNEKCILLSLYVRNGTRRNLWSVKGIIISKLWVCMCSCLCWWHCVLCKINWNLHITNLQTHTILN